ncbi:nucleoside transporter [candidate division WOR-3 bacterium]|nr:nucleoside transporter [candidate division WOR-3 bacterium]
MDIYNLVSFFGIFVLIGIAWLISSDKRNMNWRVVIWGVAIQMGLALFIFVFPAGSKIFLFLNGLVVKVLESSMAGAEFVFGRLALPPGQVSEAGEKSIGFILAFQAFPTIIFFSSLISILYYFNIMQWIIKGFAYIFTKLMRISGAESVCAASNIFVGIESALTIKPYLEKMTRSELATVLTAGMATVASNVLAIYIFSLQEQFPTIAAHLISASLLSAPAAIVMSKIIIPESEKPETLGEHVEVYYEKENTVFESIISGANSGVKLIVGIVALLIAVLGLVALIDLTLGALGGKINALIGIEINWSLKGLLGYLFYPFTIVLGVPPSDAVLVAQIIGERAILTEIPAYQHLAVMIGENLLQHPRSAVIATYALCGFAHIASMAIFIGGIAALIPGKRTILAKVGLRALIAATLACLLTASVAGTFYIKGSLLLGG